MLRIKSDIPEKLKVEFKLGDLTDSDRITHILEEVRPEVVIHLAALTPVRESFTQPVTYFTVNTLGTVNLIQACLKALGNDFRFIMASTAEVYGENGEDVKREGQKLSPMSPYAVSKATADMYLQACGPAYGIEYVILRPNNTFGRPYSGYFVEAMMEKLIENKLCDFYNPFNSRDYMWIYDHVNAYLTVLEKGFGLYNVSPGELITNIGMIKLMKKVIGSTSELKIINPPTTRPLDHRGINMDSSLIRSLGWAPKTSRIEAINKLREMYKS